MTRLAVAAPLEIEDRVVAGAVAHGDIVVLRASTSAELIERMGGSGAAVAVIGAGAEFLDAELVRAFDVLCIRVVALADQPSGTARARRHGVTVLASDAPYVEIRAAFEADGLATAVQSRGSVVVVWGPEGSPGRTTTAIAIASELALAGNRVALVDADTHAPSIAPSLGLLDEAPGIAAAARLARTDRLSVDEFDRIAQIVRTAGSEFRVLTGLAGPKRWPELTATAMSNVLTACRDWVDVCVVDIAASLESDEEISSDMFAPRRNAAALTALAAADRVVVVGAGDTVGMTRLLRGYPELVELVEPDRITVVMNKVRSTAMGLAPELQLAQTLRRFGGIESNAFLPFDQRAVDRALLEASSLATVAGRSRLRRGFQRAARALVDDVHEIETPKPQGRRQLRESAAGARGIGRLGTWFTTLRRGDPAKYGS